MRKISVCRVLNENSDKFYPLLEEGDHAEECVIIIEKILNANAINVNTKDSERCLISLKNSMTNINRFLSTLATWLTCEKVMK